MTGSLKVDVQKVMAAATSISNANKNIHTSFGTLETSIRTLDSAWDGSASEQAISAFAKIKNDFEDSRQKVMNNYVTFLNKQVGEGYTQTESANTSLADAFK